MPKAEYSVSRQSHGAPKSIAKKSRYQRALSAVAELTPRERARLVAKMQKPSAGRARLMNRLEQSQAEFKRGEFFEGTVDEMIRELTDE